MRVNFILLARFAKYSKTYRQKTNGIYYFIIFKNVEIEIRVCLCKYVYVCVVFVNKYAFCYEYG